MKKIVLFILTILSCFYLISCSENKNSLQTQNLTETSYEIENIKTENNLSETEIENLENILKNNNNENSGIYGEKLNWKIIINKSNLLNYLKEKNIFVANLKNINNLTDENKNTTKIIISNNEIEINNFKNYFNLPSNKITKIIVNADNIEIYGNGIGLNPINLITI